MKKQNVQDRAQRRKAKFGLVPKFVCMSNLQNNDDPNPPLIRNKMLTIKS